MALLAALANGIAPGIYAQQTTPGLPSTSTVPTVTPSAPAGTVPGGVQPPQPGSPSIANVASAPTAIQLGPVQGLGGGIRPPRLTPPADRPLGLDDAVRISLANNLNIFTAASQEEKAVRRVDETRTGFLPRFGLSGNYTYTGKVPTTTLGGTATTPGRTIELGTHRNYGGAVSIIEPIDLSGSLRATQGIAEAQRDAQYWALDSARRQVILSTATAFLQVLRSQNQVRVTQEQLTDAQAHVSLAQKLIAAGTIAQYDVLTAQTSLANVQQQLFAAQNAYNQALAGLNNAMGISQATTVQLSDLPVVTEPAPDFGASLTTAVRNRPELHQIDANVRTAQQSVQFAASGTKPSLSVQANYNYTGIVSGFSSLHDNWTLALVGSWSPFDWGATRARKDQAGEDVRTNQYLREQTSQGIEYQIRQALNQISDSLQRRTAAEAAVAQAREQLRLANVRYGAGAGTNTEVIDAEAALAQAENNSASALYDYYTARANFQRATGTEPLAAQALPPTAPRK